MVDWARDWAAISEGIETLGATDDWGYVIPGARGELDESGVASPGAAAFADAATLGCSNPWGIVGSIPGRPAEGEPDGKTPGDIRFIMGGGGNCIITFGTFGEL